MLGTYLKSILENSLENIVLIGKNHEVLAYSKSIKEVLKQYFNKEIKEGDFYYPDYVVEENQEIYLQAFNKATKGEMTYVAKLTANENVSLWFQYKMTPMIDDDGRLLGVSLSARDITTQKEAELKILDLSKKLKAILDNTDESVTLLDLNYRILALNKVSANAIKYNTQTEAVIGDDFREFLPDKNNPFYKNYPKAIKGISSEMVISYQTAKNELIWYSTKFNPVYSNDGQLIGVSIFAKDITSKKKLEISLKESEELFRKITGLAPVGIILTNSKFKITYANTTSRKILEYDKTEDLYKINVIDLISNLKLTSKNKIRVDGINLDIDSPIFNQERYQAITATKKNVPILLSSSSILIKDKQSYIFIIQDITDMNYKEGLISEQNDKLRDIAWHQSHIIRAPLARIMGLISLLEVENPEAKIDPDERAFIYKAILQSAYDMDKVIMDIVGKTA